MAILVVGAASAFAAEKDLPADFEAKKAEMEAKRAEMLQIFEDGDYQAWQELISEKNPDAEIFDQITADNFDEFAAAHLKINEGMEELKELGVEGPGPMGGMGGPHKPFKQMRGLKE